MPPMPGDPFDHDDDNEYPPEDIEPLVPTVVYAVIKAPPAPPTPVAYFINSWIDLQGYPHTYTITTLYDMNQASALSQQVEQIAESISAGAAFPAMSSYFNGLQAAPTTPPAAANTYAQAAPTGYSTAAVTSYPTEVMEPPPKKGHGPPATVLAVGIVVPLVACIITIVVCLLCVRHYKRKARKAQAAGLADRMSSAEMRTVEPKPPGVGVRDERAYMAPPSIPPPAPGTLATSMSPVAAGNAGQEPPVILSTTMNTYYTGIDTSDRISLSDQRSVASRETFGEEPPPPYRPRSVPPISRETSVRASIISNAAPGRNSSIRSRCDTLSGGSIIRRSNEVRSPFDDPEEEDEDNFSDVSTIRGTAEPRETDRLSMMSDDSYRDRPASSPRPGI